MKLARKIVRKGFTLVELLVAMAITAIIVGVILKLTITGVSLWKSVNDDVTTASSARIALQTLASDLESYQMKSGPNEYEWFVACKDSDAEQAVAKGKKKSRQKPAALSYVPDSSRVVFFSCAPDRNPAVSSDPVSRKGYRVDLSTSQDANDEPYRGDVSVIGYRLEYKDHILNKSASDDAEGVFPVFALYRHVVSPSRTYEKAMLQENLYRAFLQLSDDAEQDIICDNVVEMNLSVNIEYMESEPKKGKQAQKRLETVTVITTSGGAKNDDKKRASFKENEVKVKGNDVLANGKVYTGGRIVSANITVTVLTEEGVAMVENMRKGLVPIPPPPVEFFARYSRQFSTSVALPRPF